METVEFHNKLGITLNQVPQGVQTRADQFSRTNYLMETFHLEYVMQKTLALLEDQHSDAAETVKKYWSNIKHRVSINPRNTRTLDQEMHRMNDGLLYPNTVKALEAFSYKRNAPAETPQGAWESAISDPDDSPFWVPFYKVDPAQRAQSYQQQPYQPGPGQMTQYNPSRTQL